MIDPRDAEIAELRRLLAERDAVIERLLAEVAALKEQLGKSSRNSSKPPSSDPPGAKVQRKSRRASGRKPGGQPGHKKHQRELLPLEDVQVVVPCIPERCEACGETLQGQDPQPHRHQVAELPPVLPVVTEYQQHALDCPCGHRTVAPLPAGVPTGAFGPTVHALVAVLMGVYRMTKRQIPALMLDLFQLRMSLGAVVGCQQAASTAVANAVEEATSYVREQPVKHADETGWREGIHRSRAWLWVAVTQYVVVFMIHARRNADAAKELLGTHLGVLVTDRHGAYNWWPTSLRQLCWSHLERDIQAISEREGHSARVGHAMLEEIHRMFHWWHRVRDGTLARSTFRVYMRPLERRFEALLSQGVAVSNSKTKRTCTQLLKHREALWTFVTIEGVEPTNNGAEQAVRHGVIMRKISSGTHSVDGSRFVERMLTVHASLRRQHRSVLHFMSAACSAALQKQPGPSLLPSN